MEAGLILRHIYPVQPNTGLLKFSCKMVLNKASRWIHLIKI